MSKGGLAMGAVSVMLIGLGCLAAGFIAGCWAASFGGPGRPPPPPATPGPAEGDDPPPARPAGTQWDPY